MNHRLLARAAASLALTLVVVPGAVGAQAGSAARLVSVDAGPRGSVRGDRFVLESAQEGFTPGVDAQVVIAFEWEGQPGAHRCEVAWIAPDGSVALRGAVDLPPSRGRRFGAHFTMLLADQLTPGLWAAEATVDGVRAGSKTFRILPGPNRRLGADELYQIGVDATLDLAAELPPGLDARRFSGFVIADDAVLTTFQAIESAVRVQARFRDGTLAHATGVWGFSREYDWALLDLAVPPTQRRPALARDFKIGERCAFINWVEGQRVVSGCSVVGRNDDGPVPRLALSDRPTQRAVGAPLLNEKGEILALMGTSAEPLVSVFDDEGRVFFRQAAWSTASLALPAIGISRPTTGASTPFAEVARVAFRPAVTARRFAGYGFVAKGTARPDGVGADSFHNADLRSSDGTASVLLTWTSPDAQTRELSHALYDRANRLVQRGRATRLALKPGVRVDSSTPISLQGLDGEYRIDILFGEEVAWRGYIRVKAP